MTLKDLENALVGLVFGMLAGLILSPIFFVLFEFFLFLMRAKD